MTPVMGEENKLKHCFAKLLKLYEFANHVNVYKKYKEVLTLLSNLVIN